MHDTNSPLLKEEPEKNLRNYMTLFFSQYISMIGSQIVSFAVIWYLTVSTGSTLILSLATLANMVPMIIVSPIAGVLADKYSKNAILILSDGFQAMATFGLILLFSLGMAELWHILVLMAIRGAMQGFQMPVASSLTALMVPEDKIQKINALDQIFRSLLSISTPALGALAIEMFDISQIYWLDVFTFLPPAIVLLLVKIPSVTKTDKGIEKESSIKSDFGEGMNYIKSSGLMPVFILFATANFIVVPVLSLFSLLILDHHGGTVMQYGVVEIMFHVGLLAGSIFLMTTKRKSSMKGVVIAGMFFSGTLLFIGFAPQGVWWIFYGLCLLLGINIAMIDTKLMSVLQVSVPKDLQGRVFSTMFVIIKSINPLGLLIWGFVGLQIPVYWIFIMAPVISIIIYVTLMKTTNLMHYGDAKKIDSDEPTSTPELSPKKGINTELEVS